MTKVKVCDVDETVIKLQSSVIGFLYDTFSFNKEYIKTTIKWRPPSLSELTPMIFNMGLTNLGPEGLQIIVQVIIGGL